VPPPGAFLFELCLEARSWFAKIQPMKAIHPKHLIGVVSRGIATVPSQRSPEIVDLLLRLGKTDPKEALAALDSENAGLHSVEAAKRLEAYASPKMPDCIQLRRQNALKPMVETK